MNAYSAAFATAICYECPKKGLPRRLKVIDLKSRSGSIPLSEKVDILGRSIQTEMRQKNRAALYLQVSTADQKPDRQLDELPAYAERAKLESVRDYLDVAVSGRRQGRPRLDALMRATEPSIAFWCGNSTASRARLHVAAWVEIKTQTYEAQSVKSCQHNLKEWFQV